MHARGITSRLAWSTGIAGAGFAAKAALTAWCDRRGVDPQLRSPLLPMVSVPYTAATLPIWRMMFQVPRWSGPGVRVRTRFFGEANIRVRVTTPAGEARRRPLVIWLHSGGMIAGSPQFEGPMAGILARRVDAVVVAPDYRLAPQHSFPAALDDCVGTVKWAIAHADQLGIDPNRIALAGASAGGGLAATCAQRCRDEGIEIRSLALLYPMLDNRPVQSPLCAGVAWNGTSNQFAWDSYLGNNAGDCPPYSVASRRDDLTAAPPTLIAVGDIDILCAQSTEYANRLRECGIPCELRVVPGMYHAADILVPWSRKMRRLHADVTEHLRGHLSAPARLSSESPCRHRRRR
ncbi:alpha/beta hydrolase fold domain-containing protein [Mycolicibacterium helvum]